MDVGKALCGALANLALHAGFRESFAQPISARPSSTADSMVSDDHHQSSVANTNGTTTARALVAMAGDKKVKHSLEHIETLFCSTSTGIDMSS